MTPTYRSATVSIAQTNHLLHREQVMAIIKIDEKTVVFTQLMRHFGIHIVEIDLGLVQVFTKERQYKTRIRSTTCQQYGGLLVKKWSFHHQMARHQTYATLQTQTF